MHDWFLYRHKLEVGILVETISPQYTEKYSARSVCKTELRRHRNWPFSQLNDRVSMCF